MDFVVSQELRADWEGVFWHLHPISVLGRVRE
jgi:hypothetical protein